MTHDEARGLLLDLSYGELGPGEACAVREHLAGCAACGEEWARLGAARAFAAKAADERVPERGRDAILEAARQAAATGPRRGRAPSRSVTWAAFATAAALLVVGGASLKLLDARSKGASEVEAPWPEALPAAPVAPPAAPPAAATAPRAEAGERGAHEVAERSAPAPKRAAPPRRNEAAARARDGIAGARPGGGASFDSAAPRLRSGRADEYAAARTRQDAAPARQDAASAKAAPAAEPERALAGSEPADGRAAAPPAAPAAPVAPRPARKTAAATVAPSPGAVADDVERRRAEGELTEETRVLACGGAPLVRSVLRDRGGRIVKLTVRRADGDVAEGWYDDAGRLAAARGQVGGRADLPPRDPASALDAPCP
jgi:putative zinc finger protein